MYPYTTETYTSASGEPVRIVIDDEGGMVLERGEAIYDINMSSHLDEAARAAAKEALGAIGGEDDPAAEENAEILRKLLGIRKRRKPEDPFVTLSKHYDAKIWNRDRADYMTADRLLEQAGAFWVNKNDEAGRFILATRINADRTADLLIRGFGGTYIEWSVPSDEIPEVVTAAMNSYDYFFWSPRGFSNEGVHVRVRVGHTGDERFLARLKYRAASDPDATLTKRDHPIPSAIPIFGENGEGLFGGGEFNSKGEKAQYDDAGNFIGYAWKGPAD